MNWVLIAGLVASVLAGLALTAAYGFGRFVRHVRSVPSHALGRGGTPTPLDARTAELTAGRSGQSGLVMVSSNLDAFAVRALSARAAGRSLDLMYYLWKDDLTGRLLIGEVVAAADRGVRVRLLLDDIGVHGRDAAFLGLDSHPNIELRLFNPTWARGNALRRGIEMALRAFSITRRMHNKAWIADGRIAIVGGRNIGDEYFDAAETSNFRDLDLLTFGPVVEDAEKVFDAYWNSGLAVPILTLASVKAHRLTALRASLRKLALSAAARPYIERLRAERSLISLIADDRVHWSADARLLSDPPDKALGKRGENWLMRDLVPILTSARDRLEITSPYFVPGRAGAAALVALTERGVAVKVLTNSLAATDVAAVHGGYAPYRAPLLRGGVALFELRPTARSSKMSLRGSSNASLHTKAFTVDDRFGFIGSLNFDPRSASLNTEMGILFTAPALIAAMRVLFAEEISPDLSYEVRLDEARSLSWHAQEDGRPVVHGHEPEASLARRAIAWIVGCLPLESQI